MTEDEWLATEDLAAMLALLGERFGDVQYRFFVAACCRRIWPRLPQEARQAVETAERYADGAATLEDLRLAARATFRQGSSPAELEAAHMAVVRTAYRLAAPMAADAALRAVEEGGGDPAAERAEQCRLLREIVGDPSRPALIDPSWLAGNDGAVARVALGLHQRRAYDELPILADALEEAGCADGALLTHLRLPGGHVAGCWAVEAIRRAAGERGPDLEGDRQKERTEILLELGRAAEAQVDNFLGAFRQAEEERRRRSEAIATVAVMVLAVLALVVMALLGR
jgi:hypothetical protein